MLRILSWTVEHQRLRAAAVSWPSIAVLAVSLRVFQLPCNHGTSVPRPPLHYPLIFVPGPFGLLSISLATQLSVSLLSKLSVLSR